MAQQRWVDSRADRLCDGLNERGLFINRDAAADLVNDRVDTIAATLHISKTAARRYITAETIDGLADTMAGMLADEQPGVDLMTQPRDTAIPLENLGRATAGLAEAIQVYLQLDGTEFNRDQAFALAQALSLLGQFMSISVGAPTCVPKAFVARVATQLEQAANVSESSTELAAAFRRDAVRLRGLV